MSLRFFVPALLLGYIITPASAQSLPDGSRAGAALFSRYCAACHGPDARGGGPVVAWLVAAPPDLTRITARNDGVFPDERIRRHIDGREEVAVHGPREMPVWGERFKPDIESGPRDVRIDVLVEWLRSIQEAE